MSVFSWSKRLFTSFGRLVSGERCGVSHELTPCLLNMTVWDMFEGAVPGTEQLSVSSPFTSALAIVHKSRVGAHLPANRRKTFTLKNIVCIPSSGKL